MKRYIMYLVYLVVVSSINYADFRAYNDCIRGTSDLTAPNVTNWTVYNNYTSNMSGKLVDFTTGVETPVTATFTWNSSAGLRVSETSGSADDESQPRPGTPAYEVFGGIVDFSYRLIYYGNTGWWVEIEFTGLNPSKKYSFVTTAIRGANYTDRLSLFTISGHTSAVNNSSDGIYLKNGDMAVLTAGGNHLDTTSYVVRWDDIFIADKGDGTGSFKVRAEAYGTNYQAYPFGGFMLEELDADINDAPQVTLTPASSIPWPQKYLSLSAEVVDDGQGEPDGYLAIQWSQISGPDTVEFDNPNQASTQAVFPAPGQYELQIKANDGLLETTVTTTVTVLEPFCPVGDIDGDCIVSLSDFVWLSDFWLSESPDTADLDGNEEANLSDLSLVCQSWLEDWTGSVTVTLLPSEAAAGGANWRLDQGEWNPSGYVLSSIPEGTHQVEYSIITGWVSPQPQSVQVVRGQNTEVSAAYTEIPLESVVINEFMAVNSNISALKPLPSVNIYTIVAGEVSYDDWIELYNQTDTTVDLAGWYLTDDPAYLTKWQFPAGYSIAGKGYMVVYASNKDPLKYGYPFVDDLGKLHTNFELASKGYLALVQPDGTSVEYEYLDYPKQRGFVTYGLTSDGQTGYLKDATHNQANSGIYEGEVADTKFSVGRGFYEQSQTVYLSCSTPSAVIRYTTNNSIPTETNGLTYDPANPIVISTTTCLRAAAFKSDWLQSNVDTQSYIFLNDVIRQATNQNTGAQVVPVGYPTQWISNYNGATVTGDYQMDPDVVNSTAYSATIKNDLKSIPTISVVVPVDQLFGTYGIYVDQSQDGSEREGSLELIDPNGVEVFNIGCGVKMQGGVGNITGDTGGTTLNRWKSYKLSFRLVFRGVYGGQLDYPLFGPDAADSYDTVVLDSRPQNSWVHSAEIQRTRGEYVRDQVASDTQIALGSYACHGRPVHLYLNGLYWGLYWLHERPDDSFAASYLGGDKEDYDILKHDYTNIVSGSNADYLAMFSLSATSPNAVTAFENLKQKLDVADFIDYLLANYYLGNGDWDGKNWYASHNRFDPAGRWRWHMWDAEHVIDDGSMAVVNATTKNTSMAPTGLHQKWIANAEYRTLFGDRVHKHFFHNGTLIATNFASLFTNLTNQIDRAIVGESARWGDNRRAATPYTRNNEWITEVNRLLNNFIPTRRDVVLAQLTGKSPAWYPAVTAPEFRINYVNQYGGDITVPSNLSMSIPADEVWYTLDGSDPRQAGGAVNGTAVRYLGQNITLNKSVQAKARARTSGGVWSALADAVFAAGPVRDNLRITEIMYHPTDPNLEYIELKNIGSVALNLNLVRFTKGVTHSFGDVSIEAGGLVLLVKDKTLFEAYYTQIPVGVSVIQWQEGLLDNAGENIELQDALGRTILSFAYKDSWYPLTDGDGFSLTIIDPANADVTLWGQKAGWRPSVFAGGAPGTDEDGLAPDSIVINEILAHSDNENPDWIEFYNTTNQDISIGGWYLTDDAANLTKYCIPENTQIRALDYLVLYEDAHFGSTFALSENGETVILSSTSDGQMTGFQALQDFDASERNVSFGRHIKSTGGMDFVAMVSQTPGEDNSDPKVGPLVITEVQYNPSADNAGDEYIELRNISGSAVMLQDAVKTEITAGVYQTDVVAWQFTEGIDFTFPMDTTIPAGGIIIIARNPTAFQAYYAGQLPAGTVVFGPFANDTGLSNGGEKVRLCRAGDQPFGQPRNYIRVDQVNYDDESPWPVSPDGQGQTLTRITPAVYGNDVINWTAASPSPGQ
ncbi:MAG: lamin tail domain-containing protein [Anaerohalosphaeraceae bacterium]